MSVKRVILIVLDSVGVGALPDAVEYGDEGSHTLDNVMDKAEGIHLRNLETLGLGNIKGVKSLPSVTDPTGCFGRMVELSKGKDTITGHWEMAGIVTSVPFRTFPEGFSEDFIRELSVATGLEYLWRKPASGTQIINELGTKHLESGLPILYTSADSVVQIAAHEDVISLDMLYEICGKARDVADKFNVCRVIARPFNGVEGAFNRTEGRKDLTVTPPSPNLLTVLHENGVKVSGVGKIPDIFAHIGFDEELSVKGNQSVMDTTKMKVNEKGQVGEFIFSNLVDFDMLYGHRNDALGYGKALNEADTWIGKIITLLREDDILIITADHGCDPTTESTDHSREYVPLLVFGDIIKAGCDLGTRVSFADIGQTVADYFNAASLPNGTSFLEDVLR
ncbi:MAG: phosphopentomutase [Deltaproteobacteria bacterium]|nr:phosphopentomutase [Deltaproteobacteria bacterium]